MASTLRRCDAVTCRPVSEPRFLNRDPLVAVTRQAYAYGANSPLNFTDPTGTNIGPIPTSVDEVTEDLGAVKDAAVDAVERSVDVITAVKNAPITVTTAAINSWTGGDCDWAPHLTVVCYGGIVSHANPFADTWTTGNTINTELSKEQFAGAGCSPGGLLRHETVHTRQWASIGPGFPVVYIPAAGLSALFSGGNSGKYNPFEIEAGLADGGYAPCSC
jgi:hypothetical protein